ncbi:MAG: MBL fold metallo-hydrolase [Deltaproteobacteria bacterium]|nr:MBL fold metallo-hydrolase [Deltaproteobacteria bacterium]
MNIHSFTVGPFQEHTYILWDEVSKDAIVIDPGGENDKVRAYLKEHELKLSAIYSTHGHIDHIAGAHELSKLYEVPYYLNKNDEFLLEDLPTICKYFGFPEVIKPKVAGTVQAGDLIKVGKHELKILETPGHTPGGVCFLGEKDIFVGDTLFYGSIGRTDLPGGNTDLLLSSIQTQLLTLPGDVCVHCGHGSKTTIEREKERNPFLKRGSRFF